MKSELQQEAWQALQQGNYVLAAENWIQGMALPNNDDTLKEIFHQVHTLNEKKTDPDLCAILGLIALDYSDVFNGNREKALQQCVEWSKQGIDLNPEHYYCNRHAGSALYWLNDWEAASKYYNDAAGLVPSPTLQIRLFNIHNKNNPQPDFSGLVVAQGTQNAMEAYNAGVELNRLVYQYNDMSDADKNRLTDLKRGYYETSYKLYRNAIIEKNGDKLNYDPDTFAMCCHNLAIEYRDQKKYDEAILLTTEGMGYSYFMEILQNRFCIHLDKDDYEKAITDGEALMENFVDQMDLLTYFGVVDGVCNSLMELKNYEQALEWSAVGKETYYSVDPTSAILSDPEVVRCFTNFFIYEAKAKEALGIKDNPAEEAESVDHILEEMPDNPSVLISRANIFTEEGNYPKAMECYQYAIHFAAEQGKQRSVQVALYNLGYLQVAHLRDDESAFESFEQSIGTGNQDFWCYYWATHCGYHLGRNEETVHYGSLALQTLPSQEGVSDDIIAEIYEHIGTSQLDLGMYTEAAENLRSSLRYNNIQTTQDNLKTAEINLNNKGGFFKKLFGN